MGCTALLPLLLDAAVVEVLALLPVARSLSDIPDSMDYNEACNDEMRRIAIRLAREFFYM